MENKNQQKKHSTEIVEDSFDQYSLEYQLHSPRMSITSVSDEIEKPKLCEKVSGTSTTSSRSSVASISSIIDRVKSVRFPSPNQNEDDTKAYSSMGTMFKRTVAIVKLSTPIEKRINRKSPDLNRSPTNDKRDSKTSLDSTSLRLNEELEKIKEITKNKYQTEKLMTRVFPRDVAKQLSVGSSVEPMPYESVTIYFSDIVGYTNMVSELDPMQVITWYINRSINHNILNSSRLFNQQSTNF